MTEPEKITPEDLLDVMREADVLETFCHLAEADREKFIRWIGMARDDDSHWRRIHALVLALRTGPLQSSAPDAPADYPEAVG